MPPDSFTTPEAMRTLIMKLPYTEVKFYPKVKSQTGLNSLWVLCKRALGTYFPMRKQPDVVRGLILLRGFRPAHQQVELVQAMRLRSTRTNRSASCLCQGLDSKLKNLD